MLGAIREMSKMLGALEGDDLVLMQLHCVEWLEDTAGQYWRTSNREQTLAEPEDDLEGLKLQTKSILVVKRAEARAAKDWPQQMLFVTN